MTALAGWLINKKPAFASFILLSPNIGGLGPIQNGIQFTSAFQHFVADMLGFCMFLMFGSPPQAALLRLNKRALF